MAINWIKNVESNGNATLTNNYLLTSKAFADKFNNCYLALVGIDEKKNIVLKPLTLDEAESLMYESNLKVKVNVQRSYVRFGNTKAMESIKNNLSIDIPKEGIKGTTTWNKEDETLVVSFKGGK